MMKVKLRYHLISTIAIAVFGFLAGLFFCSSCWTDAEMFVRVGFYSATLWVVLWKGNEAIAQNLDYKISWSKQPIRRLLLGLMGHIVFTGFATFLVNYAAFKLYGWNENIMTIDGLLHYSLPALVITIIISSVLTARRFFLSWRQLAIEKERMEKEIINSKYEVLKNQVNPHFLFNSLNVLTSLVYKDPDLSASFIRKLSDVYRYVLDVRDRQVVDLEEELEFIKSYAFLLKIRHAEGLNISIHSASVNGDKVAPLAIQMLVENAVKHNVISKDEPLHIKIERQNDFILIQNNLQRKPSKKRSGHDVGLNNIVARYKFLSNKQVNITEDDEYFSVRLPIIQVDI